MEYAGFVAEYTTRELSNTDDIVAAFMGLLNRYRKASTNAELNTLPSAQDYGLLDFYFGRCLLWMPHINCSLRRRESSTSDHSQLPSWSWTGWVGPVEYLIESFGAQDWTFKPRKYCPSGLRY